MKRRSQLGGHVILRQLSRQVSRTAPVETTVRRGELPPVLLECATGCMMRDTRPYRSWLIVRALVGFTPRSNLIRPGKFPPIAGRISVDPRDTACWRAL